jgi:hypothetical protein
METTLQPCKTPRLCWIIRRRLRTRSVPRFPYDGLTAHQRKPNTLADAGPRDYPRRAFAGYIRYKYSPTFFLEGGWHG